MPDTIRFPDTTPAERDAFYQRFAWNPAHIAASTGDIEAIRSVDQAAIGGATINGLTPLHVAVWYQQAEAVDALIARGADRLIQDNRGFTPNDYAPPTADEPL